MIGGTAPPDRGVQAMDAVREHLYQPYGIHMHWPPYTGIPLPPAPLTCKAPGAGENAGIFNQPCAWAIWAEAALGRGDRAFLYYRNTLPPVICKTVGVDRYQNEPYCYSSNVLAPPDPRAGKGDLAWLTGTAACMYLAATIHILGIKPRLEGLQIDPCIPNGWKEFRVRRQFRGVTYDITVRNPDGVCKGVKELKVDGKVVDGNVIRPVRGKKRVKVVATLG